MRFTLYQDVKQFYYDTYDVLMRHEAQNLIPLGNVILGNAGQDKTGWRDPANWFMATVSDGSGLRLTAVMTPPHNLTLYATDNIIDAGAIACLIEGIEDTGVAINGIMTEKNLATSFATAFCAAKGIQYAVEKNQRIYELTEVNPDIPAIGTLRPVKESDLAFLPYWIEGFNHDCFGQLTNPSADIGPYRHVVDAGRRYILEDEGIPVSMAGATREMRTVCGVGAVYTPPYFRGRGYASACVAELSRRILARGFAKCVLYTDLANPTSNSIYQKIGYRPLCDSSQIKFESK